MNVYDFDKTIYNGDSTIDFYFYCLGGKPSVLSCIFRQLHGIFLYAAGRTDTKAMKESFFTFLKRIADPEDVVVSFWESHRDKIKPWYLRQKEDSDVVISASPSFLLAPICKDLGIDGLIATEMQISTGKITGENCKGEEKVRRFSQRYPDAHIKKFYSDSLSDQPLADIAQSAYIVKGSAIIPWEREH